MKKIISAMTTLAVAATMITGCIAAETDRDELTLTMQIGNPIMTVNGEQQGIDDDGTVPVIRNERTLVPVRAVIEAMGGSVEWNEDTQTAKLEYNDNTIELIINSNTAYLNGEANTIDTAPAIINERTMLPIRFIAEGFNFNVDWDGETQTVTIKGSTGINQETSSSEAPTEALATETPAPEALTTEAPTAETEEPTDAGNTLVVYYSASGNTEKIADYIVSVLDADTFVIEPTEPYTDEDLNYNDDDSRVVREHNNEDERHIELSVTTPDNWQSYDTVFVGYPIWWGIAAWPVSSFVEQNDFTGKTVIPFCTSASSSLGESGDLLKDAAKGGEWLTGMRFRSGASENDVRDWIDGLDIK